MCALPMRSHHHVLFACIHAVEIILCMRDGQFCHTFDCSRRQFLSMSSHTSIFRRLLLTPHYTASVTESHQLQAFHIQLKVSP